MSGNELPTMPATPDTATVGAGMAGDTGVPEHELETAGRDDETSDDTSDDTSSDTSGEE